MTLLGVQTVVNNIAYPSQGSCTRVSDASGYVAARASRDGTLAAISWRQMLVLEGRCYHVDVGSVSTPIVGGGNGTVIDPEQPEFSLSIPSGTSIMPLGVRVVLKQPL